MELEKLRKLDIIEKIWCEYKMRRLIFFCYILKYVFYFYNYIINESLIRFFFLGYYYVNSIWLLNIDYVIYLGLFYVLWNLIV